MLLAVQGALLLVLFQVSHTLEHSLTDRAQASLQALFASIPTEAVLVDLLPSGAPNLASAATVKASDVQVGQHALVKTGEQVHAG